MIKGLAITPPLLGRISIGKVVEKDGKRLPQKDDQFTVTSQIQNNGEWLLHPLDETLRQNSDGDKLRAIPVRFLFNDPELNLRANYSLFDREKSRPICVGNGETCKRQVAGAIEKHPCPSPSLCDIAQNGNCKPYGRLYVKIGDDDDLGVFVFRTTGFNSIRTLAARLSYYSAVSNDLLAFMPFELRLRGKSTQQSYRKPIYYVDLCLRPEHSLENAVRMAKESRDKQAEAGLNQAALDNAANTGIENAAFECGEDEAGEVVEEFFQTNNPAQL
ncbi:Uncharacterised protein [BD1-7 clade bacterium]|uniref:Hydrolase or metal-binding protein n=1 Tax=BD1-7 clade bacterium TaxID=2029982 RepID=A0A5S9QUC0_9GAMM|nr:Uncharacterised protein [BD1-7 clade bacterium]CAA0122994.1 Uncharacterised protein [BD1-7 clade bacterium]